MEFRFSIRCPEYITMTTFVDHYIQIHVYGHGHVNFSTYSIAIDVELEMLLRRVKVNNDNTTRVVLLKY